MHEQTPTATPNEAAIDSESGPDFTVLTVAAGVIGSALVWLRKRDDN